MRPTWFCLICPGEDERDVQQARRAPSDRGMPLAEPPPAAIQHGSVAYFERPCTTAPRREALPALNRVASSLS
jgi:hypothetical protein